MQKFDTRMDSRNQEEVFQPGAWHHSEARSQQPLTTLSSIFESQYRLVWRM